MPNTKSAKKRLRQSVDRRTQNRAARSDLRTQCRKVLAAIKAEDAEKSETEFRVAVKKLDRAGFRGIIHRNAAARLKSRMSARIKALKQG